MDYDKDIIDKLSGERVLVFEAQLYYAGCHKLSEVDPNYGYQLAASFPLMVDMTRLSVAYREIPYKDIMILELLRVGIFRFYVKDNRGLSLINNLQQLCPWVNFEVAVASVGDPHLDNAIEISSSFECLEGNYLYHIDYGLMTTKKIVELVSNAPMSVKIKLMGLAGYVIPRRVSCLLPARARVIVSGQCARVVLRHTVSASWATKSAGQDMISMDVPDNGVVQVYGCRCRERHPHTHFYSVVSPVQYSSRLFYNWAKANVILPVFRDNWVEIAQDYLGQSEENALKFLRYIDRVDGTYLVDGENPVVERCGTKVRDKVKEKVV